MKAAEQYADRCELEPTSVDAGAVGYQRERVVHLILTNVGLVTANWQFLPLPGVMFGDPQDRAYRAAPRWASLQPSQV